MNTQAKIHCVSDKGSSDYITLDIWSFRVFDKFLAGPNFPILKLIGYMVNCMGNSSLTVNSKTDGINAHI